MLSANSNNNVWQQVLALDARYNTYRVAATPAFKTLYIRRRTQLLRENAKRLLDTQARRTYMRLRSQLLAERYGVLPSDGSIRSVMSKNALSASQLTLEMDLNESSRRSPTLAAAAAKTDQTAARRASFGGNATDQQVYAFAGVHHVFDQHAGSSGAISRLKFAHDEPGRLAISSADGTISICDVSLELGKSSMSLKLQGHSRGITDFAWSVSNDLIVSCSLDCTVRLWTSNSGT